MDARITRLVLGLSLLSALLGGSGVVMAKTLTCDGSIRCIGTKRPDTITVTGGGQFVYGRGGGDTINALGPGGSEIRGGGGDDVINAKNNVGDRIECGSGQDRVHHDAALDALEQCEIVTS
jgi:hypothetical protein